MKNKNASVNPIPDKKYLSIGEVADRFGLTVEVLRKWERDFPRVLKPMRTKGDSRLYDRKQVEKVALIHRLLRIEGLTIEGARRRLSQADGQRSEEVRQEVISRLATIRQQLMSVIEELDNIVPQEVANSSSIVNSVQNYGR